jgi:hypothetical protein
MTVLGSAKMVCNPTNWPINVLHEEDIVVTAALTPGSTVTVEADIYCSWCGHYYPTPVTTTVASLASIDVTPPTATVYVGDTEAFTATGYDTLGNPIPINPDWSVTGGIGTVSPPTGASTTFTASAKGIGTVVATVGALSDYADVTVPNRPPVADAGPDQIGIEQTSHAGADVTLDGSGSSDPDGDALDYTWTWTGGSATEVNPTVTLPLGTTTVTLTVDDGDATDTDTVEIEVVDTTAPEIDITGDTLILWPPNHKYHTFTIHDFDVSVSDICDAECDIDDVIFTSVSSSEPDDVKGGGDGHTINDCLIEDDDQTVKVRAERQGKGVGRTYTIEFKVTDASENTATGTLYIFVPHDQG